MGGLLFSVGDIIREGAVYGVGFLEQDFVAVLLDTQVQHTASVGKLSRTTTRSSLNVSIVTTFREEGSFRRA
jgi:hypothetical protein